MVPVMLYLHLAPARLRDRDRLARLAHGPVLVALIALFAAGGPDAQERSSSGPCSNPTPGEELAPRRAAPRLPTRTAWNEGFGIAFADGRLMGLGPRYKVVFRAGGFELVPAFGRAAVRTQRLVFELASIRRGETTLCEASGEAVPERAGAAVVYEHGGGIVESYAVVREGIEQSFVFAERLRGSGDLVVRGRLSTELVPDPRTGSGDGLRFELPGVGSLRYGGVTGIDARGRTVAGDVLIDGEFLELSLPDAFVQDAVYPLTLDPLIGTVFSLSSEEAMQTDVAYDQKNDVYLVVWARVNSSSDFDIVGQRVSGGGSLVGSPIPIESAPSNQPCYPTVANVWGNGKFLVAWETEYLIGVDSDIHCRSVDPASGFVSPGIQVLAGGPANQGNPQAGGEIDMLHDDVIVLWWEQDSGLLGRQVLVPSSGDPIPFGSPFTVSSNLGDGGHELPRAGGEDGQFLVVWSRWYSSPPPGDYDLLARVFDRNGNPLSSEVAVADEIGPSESSAAVDGDGWSWVIAYTRRETLDSGDGDIHARKASFDGSTLTIGPDRIVEADFDDDERDPAVGFTGEAYVILWADEAPSFEYDLWAASVDPFTADPCEPHAYVSFGREWYVEIATRFGGWGAYSAPPDDALCVWESRDSSPTAIDGALWRTDAGAVQNLLGGCGSGGEAFATCATVGNGNFTHRVRGAAALRPAWLIVGLEEFRITCGPCVLVPSVFQAFVFDAGFTDFSGNAAVTTPLPGAPVLVGLSFIDQWIIDTVPGDCGWLGADLSNAIEVEIQ